MKLARKAAATTLTVAALSLASAPALAAQQTVHDPTGDASAHGLDIVAATVRNLDRAVVVRVRFAKAVRGDLIVSVDPRGGRGLRLVSEYRPTAHTNNVVMAGAFTDKHVPKNPGPLACKGFRVTWSAETPTVRMRMPSHCLHAGDYGAVRYAVLTEERGGDSDYAPDTKRGASGWIPRG